MLKRKNGEKGYDMHPMSEELQIFQ